MVVLVAEFFKRVRITPIFKFVASHIIFEFLK